MGAISNFAKTHSEPTGSLAIRVLAMPSDTNPYGDIFGGWVASQMDLAGMSVAQKRAMSRITTVAIDGMSFISPVHVGEFVCCYAEVIKVGRTSIAVQVSAWAQSLQDEKPRLVTEGVFTYVAIDPNGRPWPVDRD